MISSASAPQQTVYAIKAMTVRANALPILVLVIGGTSRGNGVEMLQIVNNMIDTLSIA